MLLTEFNQEAFAQAMRTEGWEEGRAEGLTEGRAEGRAEGCTEGRAEGRTEGETRVNLLNSRLISEKRFDDLARATSDKLFQAQLYKEYGL